MIKTFTVTFVRHVKEWHEAEVQAHSKAQVMRRYNAGDIATEVVEHSITDEHSLEIVKEKKKK